MDDLSIDDQRALTFLKAADPKLMKKLVCQTTEFKLSGRTANCFRNEGIKYVGDIVTKTRMYFLNTTVRNFGAKSLEEVRVEILEPLGLTLGMNIKGWPEPYLGGSWPQPVNPSYSLIVGLLIQHLENLEREHTPTPQDARPMTARELLMRRHTGMGLNAQRGSEIFHRPTVRELLAQRRQAYALRGSEAFRR